VQPGNSVWHPSSTTVNLSGTKIVAQFTNANLLMPSIAVVTVTNPNGTAGLLFLNAFYLPLSLMPPSLALNPAVNSFLKGNADSMTIGDFNLNGILDLAVVTQPSGMLSILNGNPDGSFTSRCELRDRQFTVGDYRSRLQGQRPARFRDHELQ